MSKAKVSVRALEGRVRRALAKQDEALKKCREDSRWFVDLGEYYTVDIYLNSINAKHIDLQDLGRELGVLKSYEELAD